MSPQRILTLLVAVVLAACGSGGSGGISGSGGVPTGTSRGPIDGFGSVIVNGIPFDSDTATITKDGEPATQAELSVGQMIEVQGDFEQRVATTITYRSEIKGPLTTVVPGDPALGSGTLQVLGQTVRVNAATIYDGTTLASLSPGDLLEVSGARVQGGAVVATYIELKQQLDDYKVVGTVADASPTQFRIGGLELDTTVADLDDLPGGIVVDGQRVEAKGSPLGWDPLIPRLVASKVEPAEFVVGIQGQRLELEGYITDFVSPTQFQVLGTSARTTASTVFTIGSVTSLTNNVKVLVKGFLDGSGVLEISTCEVLATGDYRTTWTIASTSEALATVTVLGLEWTIKDFTELEDQSDADVDPLGFEDLDVGDYVRVRGYRDGANLLAERLRRRNLDSDARLRGPVTQLDGLGAGEFEVNGILLVADGSTVYRDEFDQSISQAEFFDALFLGRFVDAKWDPFGGNPSGQAVDELELEID